MVYLSSDIVISILRNDYDNWIKKLSLEEIKAIVKYSYNSIDSTHNRFFFRLNAMLRNEYNGNDTIILEKYADIISRALKYSPLKHNIICYRGVDNLGYTDIKLGKIIKINQFYSTSVIKTRALKKKYLEIIYVPKGAYGAYIEKLSKYPKQREFLLDKDTDYKIIGYKDNIIELEVIIWLNFS